MRKLRVRFTLRSMMIVIAVLSVAFACLAFWWNQSSAIDPFDALEIIGPAPPGQRHAPSSPVRRGSPTSSPARPKVSESRQRHAWRSCRLNRFDRKVSTRDEKELVQWRDQLIGDQ